MALSQPYGFQNLLKDGYKHYAGLEESMLRNIEACKMISNMTKTSLGPLGMNKMVINHLDKIFVTSDAATILKEVEVQHPAAKMIAMAARMQESECGDMTNFVISFAGELLAQAENLIKTGLHPSDIITGYKAASLKALELIEGLSQYEVTDFRNVEQVLPVINSVLCPKISTYYEHFGQLVTDACIKALGSRGKSFDTEYIRISKILGGSLYDSQVISGMIITRAPETTKHQVEKPKIAVFACPFVMDEGETKTNLLIKNAEDLLNFTKSEEAHMEKLIKEIVDAGVNTIVVGGSISELANHYFEKYGIMVIKSMSKFEVKRLCKCIGALGMPKLGCPTQDELGYCDRVHVKEIGSEKVTVFEKSKDDSKLVSIVLRGATTTLLDDVERAINDGVNTFRVMLSSPRFLRGAGATESYLSNELDKDAGKIAGLDQYSYAKYGQAFEVISNTLLDNAGLDKNIKATELLSQNVDGPNMSVDVMNGRLVKSEDMEVYDHLASKKWAIQLASDAAITVLKVDQIIVAKPAGGPKPKSQAGWDNDDDHC